MLRGIGSAAVDAAIGLTGFAFFRAVTMRAAPELTQNTAIQLNARVSLRRSTVTISLADDARSPLEFRLCGRLGRGGGGLALVPVRFCRTYFQALNERKAMTINRSIPATRMGFRRR